MDHRVNSGVRSVVDAAHGRSGARDRLGGWHCGRSCAVRDADIPAGRVGLAADADTEHWAGEPSTRDLRDRGVGGRRWPVAAPIGRGLAGDSDCGTARDHCLPGWAGALRGGDLGGRVAEVDTRTGQPGGQRDGAALGRRAVGGAAGAGDRRGMAPLRYRWRVQRRSLGGRRWLRGGGRRGGRAALGRPGLAAAGRTGGDRRLVERRGGIGHRQRLGGGQPEHAGRISRSAHRCALGRRPMVLGRHRQRARRHQRADHGRRHRLGHRFGRSPRRAATCCPARRHHSGTRLHPAVGRPCGRLLAARRRGPGRRSIAGRGSKASAPTSARAGTGPRASTGGRTGGNWAQSRPDSPSPSGSSSMWRSRYGSGSPA